MYTAPGTADRPQGIKFWCQQKGFITLPICSKFQTNLIEVWCHTIFVMIWYMYIAPGKADSPPGDKILISTERPYHFTHLLQASKNLFKVWFYKKKLMI